MKTAGGRFWVYSKFHLAEIVILVTSSLKSDVHSAFWPKLRIRTFGRSRRSRIENNFHAPETGEKP